MNARDPSLDPLTGALTREAFHGELRAALAAAAESASGVSLLVIDLDHFKSVNDAFGHLRGDQVLAEFASRARAIVRESDVLGRFGGDEFVLLLPRTTAIQALLLAQRLIELVSSVPFHGDPPLTMTLTAGCATFPADAASADRLFAVADQRLLVAKRAGRSRALAEDGASGVDPAAGRLIEREAALALGQRFLAELPQARTGQLLIGGDRGSGRTALLAELGRAARLRGYALIELSGSPGLRSRHLGAWTEARCSWPTSGAPDLALIPPEQRAVGLVICVDRLADTDAATVAALRAIFASQRTFPVGLIAVTPTPLQLVDAGLHLEVQLAPLSVRGVQLWLRGQLRWEPPPALISCVAEQSDGLPGRLRAALALLKRHGLLQQTALGWEVVPDLAARGAALRASESLRREDGLPALTDELVGRDTEIRAARAQLAGGRLLTIVGPGGVGKTRLALQIAAEIREHYPHGAWFAPLATVADTDGMARRLVEALQLEPLAGSLPRRQVLHALANRAALLVLDNLEQVTGAAELVTELLDAAPQLRLIVTSRERLGLPLERLCDLRGLEGGASLAAVTLFRQQAVAAGAADPGDTAEVRRICAMVGGMPLGIKLTAAWTVIYSLSEIAALVAARVSADADPLSAVFAYFWDQLSADEARAVAALAVFQGGFRREEAQFVTGISPLLLAALVDRAFLGRGAAGRYTLHPLLQQEASARLWRTAAAGGAASRRHAYVYAGLAVRAGSEVARQDQIVWLDVLGREQDNLRAALQWLVEQDPGAAVRVAADLAAFWRIRGYWSEGLSWLLRAVAAVRAAPQLVDRPEIQPELKRAIGWAGTLAFEQAAYGQARDLLGERLALARVDGDAPAVAATLATLGHIALIQGEYGLARLQLTESIRLARAHDEQPVLLRALNILGETDHREGRNALAHEHYLEACTLAQQLGDRRELADSLLGLGNSAMLRGALDEAARHFQDCLDLALAIGDRQRSAESTGNLGGVALARGDYPGAVAQFTQAYAVFSAIDDQFSGAMALCYLGEAAHALGQTAQAQHYLQQCLAQAGRIGAVPVVLMALSELAALSAAAPPIALAVQQLVANHPATHAENRARAEQRAAELLTRVAPDTVIPPLDLAAAVAVLSSHHEH